MRERVDETEGPFGDVIGELRRLAAAGEPLAPLLQLTKLRVADEYGVFSAKHAFMQAFDMSLATSDLLDAWSGWHSDNTGASAEEIHRLLPPLVPRGPDTPMADLGPGCAASLAEFLESSEEPFWTGVRRELDSRGARHRIALAEGWRQTDETFTFVAALDSCAIEFTYEWPDGRPDAGTITSWEDVTDGALARDFQHALRHARELKRGAFGRGQSPAAGIGEPTDGAG